MARPARNPGKKLARLGRAWAGGESVRTTDAEFSAEAKLLGIDPSKMGGLSKAIEKPLIWPDMADSFALFCSMATQWKWVGAGMAGAFRVGLDYTALEAVARSINVVITPRIFSDLRTLESEALSVWAKKRK